MSGEALRNLHRPKHLQIYILDGCQQTTGETKFDFCKCNFFVLICIKMVSRPAYNYKNVMHENGRGGNKVTERSAFAWNCFQIRTLYLSCKKATKIQLKCLQYLQ